jgi:peptide/nickel transport system permease protein
MGKTRTGGEAQAPNAAAFSPAAGMARLLGRFSEAARRYRVEWWILVFGAAIITTVALMTAFPGLFTAYNPTEQGVGPQMAAPSVGHMMGTDNLGRDVGARMVYGARTILGVAIAASILSAAIGIPIGLVSGFAGNWLDKVLSLIMDSVYSFPGLILAIAFAAMLGPGVINITVAVSVVYIPTYFRLVRGQTLSIKEELYVDAARAIGARKSVILAKYVFPNVIATVVVVFSLNVADAIMTEAALSYIGLGLPAGIPDWGMDLSMGKKFLPSGVWWMITYPGAMIMTLALGFTMLGEGLSEILNPRLQEY